MTDAEFVEAVLALWDRPVTRQEELNYGVQCAADYGQVYMDRLNDVIRRYREE